MIRAFPRHPSVRAARSRPRPTGALATVRTVGVKEIRRPLWIAGAAASAGAGIIHLALAPEHVRELGVLGYGFFGSAALQLGWAAVLLIAIKGFAGRASERWLRSLAISGIVINVAILTAWAWSRIVGLPSVDAPWTPEAIGRPDMMASVCESMVVLGLAAWLQGWSVVRFSRPPTTIAAVAGLAIGMIAAGTLFALVPEKAGDSHAASHAATVEGSRD